MVYTREEVKEASEVYFNSDSLAADVFFKYALNDGKDNYLELTPPDMQDRLAREFARTEAKYPNPMSLEEISSLLKRDTDSKHATSWTKKYGFGAIVPQGSPMSAIGNTYKTQSSANCFVVPVVEDSYGGICYTDEQLVQIMKRRGGVGFDVSKIRPKGCATSNAAVTSDGISIFLERYSNSTREVAQGGRRGALMLTCSVMHPEIETFIHIKRDRSKVTGANMSIRFTDEFLRAVENDEEFTLRFPVDSSIEEAKVTKVVRAKDIWDQFVDAAWDSAEPGSLFWDTILARTPSDCYASKGFRSVSTNPCSEIVLSSFKHRTDPRKSYVDSCRLLVTNLTHFVKNPFLSNAYFDEDYFEEVVQKSQRLMDDLVDLEIELVDKIISKVQLDPEDDDLKRNENDLWNYVKNAAIDGRRTGLGITGLGDALAMLGIRYGSEESVNVTGRIYQLLALNAYRSTVQLAKERGAFPIYEYDLEKDHGFINQIMDLDPQLRADWIKYGRRNIALTTTAPTGSLSTMTQTTGGIEPAIFLEYTRRRKINPDSKNKQVDFVDDLGDEWQHFKVSHHGLKHWKDVTGNDNIEESPYYKATANEIDWITSVKLQGAAQKWICHSISKTLNLPKTASHELVSKVYLDAWKTGCKGFTVYRESSRDGVLVEDDSAEVDIVQRISGVPEEELRATIDIGKRFSQNMPKKHLAYLNEIEGILKLGLDDIRITSSSENHAPKRPKELSCDIYKINVKGKSYVTLVGLLNNKPYEIFCGLSQYINLPAKINKGLIEKMKKKNGDSVYNLKIPSLDEELVFKNIVKMFNNPVYGTFTRVLSLALRHQVPPQYVVEQLQKQEGDMQSFGRVISRVLKNYIADGTKSTLKKCDGCGLTGTIVYQESCATCASCSWSKCG